MLKPHNHPVESHGRTALRNYIIQASTLLDWINEEITALADEQFFHKDYEETLVDTYGADYEDELVVEGGVVNA